MHYINNLDTLPYSKLFISLLSNQSMDKQEINSGLFVLWQENVSATLKYMNTMASDFNNLMETVRTNNRRMTEIVSQMYMTNITDVSKYFSTHSSLHNQYH